MKILEKILKKKDLVIFINLENDKSKIEEIFRINKNLDIFSIEDKAYPLNNESMLFKLAGARIFCFERNNINPLRLNTPEYNKISPQLLDKMYLPKLIHEFSERAKKTFKWMELIIGIFAGLGTGLFIGSKFLGGI